MRDLLHRRRFLTQMGLGATASLLLPGGRISARPGPRPSAAALPRSTPEAQGVSSKGLLSFLRSIETARLALHSVMVVRHGHVVAEGWWAPYRPEHRHTLYSLSKSFTSTAIGLAVAEGRLSLEDKVRRFFAQDFPAVIDPRLESLKVRDLLMMGTGHLKESLTGSGFSAQDPDWVRRVLAAPVERDPGTHFVYNNGATYLLSAILQEATGQSVVDYLKPRLFDPLGIVGADWETDPAGRNTGAWGLRVRTEDLAKFGQLYLSGGLWGGERVLPESWVSQATGRRIETVSEAEVEKRKSNDWAQGYGYQFWQCRHNAFRGDGALGQFCIGLRDQDGVVAITAEVGDMQAVMNAVWDNLLPAMGQGTLPTDAPAHGELQKTLASLTLPTPTGAKELPSGMRPGKKVYRLEANSLGIQKISLQLRGDRCEVSLFKDRGEQRLVCGMGHWVTGMTDISPVPLKLQPTSGPKELPTAVACSAAWADDKTLSMRWQFVETAHYDTVRCQLEGDRLRWEFKRSISVLNPGSADPRPILTGALQS